MRSRFGRRHLAMHHDRSHLARDRFDPTAETAIENHHVAAPRLAIKYCALWNGKAQHLLEAQPLGAKLHAIGIVDFGSAAFVFDRKGNFMAVVRPMNLDDVGLPDKTQPMGDKRQGSVGPERAARHRLPLLHSLVQ